MRSFGSRLGLVRGQHDTKLGAPRPRLDLDLTAVSVHDTLRDVETEAAAMADRFGREKRIEDPMQDFRRNARTVVDDSHHDPSTVASSVHQNLAAGTGGVDGVVDEVRPNLI